MLHYRFDCVSERQNCYFTVTLSYCERYTAILSLYCHSTIVNKITIQPFNCNTTSSR